MLSGCNQENGISGTPGSDQQPQDDSGNQQIQDGNDNQQPIARISEPKPHVSGQTVTLNGSGSYDPDGDTLSYQWTQTGGASIVLSNSSSANLTFVAPTVSRTMQFTFQLTVNDSELSNSATVSVPILPTVDDKSPSIVSRSPQPETSGVPTTTEISVGFNEALLQASVDTKSLLVSQNGSDVPGVVSYDSASNTVTIKLSSALSPNTTYTVTIANTLEDLWGNAFAGDSWSFTTGFGNETVDDSDDPDLPWPTNFTVEFADMVLDRWPNALPAFDKGGWNYPTGIVLRGIAEVFEVTGDARYGEYVQKFVDKYVDKDGNLSPIEKGPHNLDTFQPSVLLLVAAEQHPDDPRYLAAAARVRKKFDDFPTNSLGGYWHKTNYPNEMWLDGLYMAEPFLARYGALTDDCGDFCFETPVFQMTLLAERVRLPGGLFLHGWDEDRNAKWCDGDCAGDSGTGLSPEVWSRGTGWFAMALVDTIRYLPQDFQGRKRLEDLLRDLAEGAAANQDPTTGLWCQVVNKCDQKDNWIEASGSAMLIYSIKRGVDMGVLDRSYLDVVKVAWAGLVEHMITYNKGRPVINKAAAGMSIQKSYDDYVGISRVSNWTHGICAVLLAAAAMEY